MAKSTESIKDITGGASIKDMMAPGDHLCLRKDAITKRFYLDNSTGWRNRMEVYKEFQVSFNPKETNFDFEGNLDSIHEKIEEEMETDYSECFKEILARSNNKEPVIKLKFHTAGRPRPEKQILEDLKKHEELLLIPTKSLTMSKITSSSPPKEPEVGLVTPLETSEVIEVEDDNKDHGTSSTPNDSSSAVPVSIPLSKLRVSPRWSLRPAPKRFKVNEGTIMESAESQQKVKDNLPSIPPNGLNAFANKSGTGKPTVNVPPQPQQPPKPPTDAMNQRPIIKPAVPNGFASLNDLKTEEECSSSSSSKVPPNETDPFKLPPNPNPAPPKPNIFIINPHKIVLPTRPPFKLRDRPPKSTSSALNGDPLEIITLDDDDSPPPASTNHVVESVPTATSTTSTSSSSKQNGIVEVETGTVFQCDRCPVRFTPFEDNQFRQHLILEHGFEPESDVYLDQRRVFAATPMKPLKHGCGICGNVFPSRYEIKRHIESSHENFLNKVIIYPTFRCGQCLKGFSSSFELTNHCLVCSDRYPNPETVRELAKAYLKCDVCKKTHTNMHEASRCFFGKKILRCALCFDIFMTKDNLYKHLSMYHGLQYVKCPMFTLPCPFCSITGNNESWGKYQEIFPHIVADHYQPNLEVMVSGSGAKKNNPLFLQGEPGMPIVMSVVGNYNQTGKTKKVDPPGAKK